jgi:carboxylesterase type B
MEHFTDLNSKQIGGNNEGLFRGAILQSGAPVPVESEIRGQRSFDVVAKGTNCYTARDKIACLRAVPYAKLHAAISKSLLFSTLPCVIRRDQIERNNSADRIQMD